MKTLEEVYETIDILNEEAHQLAWDTWVIADQLEESENEEDYSKAEKMREEASDEQAFYFRDGYWDLNLEDQDAIKYWLEEDSGFREEFVNWFGKREFKDDFKFDK